MKSFNSRQNNIMSSWVLSVNIQPVTTMIIWKFVYVIYSIMYDTKLYVLMSCIVQGTFHK